MKRFLEEFSHDVLAFTRMFDYIKDLVLIMKVDSDSFKHIYINKSAAETFGIKESFVGKRLEEVLPFKQAASLNKKLQQVHSTSEPIVFTEEFVLNNVEIICESTVSPIKTGNTESNYLLVILRDITERKKKEKERRLIQKRLSSLVEHNSDAVFEVDRNGNFIAINNIVTEITGYNEHELIGTSFEKLVNEEKLIESKQHFLNSLEGLSEEYETSIYHKEGHFIQLHVKNIPIIVDEDLVGVYGIAKDITEEKKMQVEIREKNEEIKAFWTNSVIPIFRTNMQGEIIRVNPAFEETFGFCEEEVVGKIDILIPDGMKDELINIYKQLAHGEAIPLHETKRKTKHGELVDILASYTPARDVNDKIKGAYVFYKNVTELKRAEQKLLQSQKNYQLITENAFDIIKLINPFGMVEYVSPSNEKILGYSNTEVVGKSFLTYIHPEDVPVFEKIFNHLIAGESHSTVEYRAKHRSGHYIWIEATATPVIEEGKVLQIVTIARDITERIRLRNKLEKAAFYDYLSGLPNRRVFEDNLTIAIQEAKLSNKKVAIMMLDGRRFKYINDTFGHEAGDAVIVEMGRRARASVRETDIVARIGGDEMAIILPEIDSIHIAEEIANRMINAFNVPFFFRGHEIDIGVGIGIAIYPDHSIKKNQLVNMADKALYLAKESTRNEFKVYEA